MAELDLDRKVEGRCVACYFMDTRNGPHTCTLAPVISIARGAGTPSMIKETRAGVVCNCGVESVADSAEAAHAAHREHVRTEHS